MNRIYIRTKYAIDFFFALLALAVASPLLLAVAVAIKAEDGGQVFFKQIRTGKYGKKFYCYKFRSMKGTDVAFDKRNPVISEQNANLTKVGRFIRKFKIDELPQLINIVKGDMCFVAPRPLLPVYDSDYKDWELVKFTVRPGLTGLGQVNGNGYLSIEDRKYYDVYYAMHASPLLDQKILFKTAAVLFAGEKKFFNPVMPEEYETLKREVKKNFTPDPQTFAQLSGAENEWRP